MAGTLLRLLLVLWLVCVTPAAAWLSQHLHVKHTQGPSLCSVIMHSMQYALSLKLRSHVLHHLGKVLQLLSIFPVQQLTTQWLTHDSTSLFEKRCGQLGDSWTMQNHTEHNQTHLIGKPQHHQPMIASAAAHSDPPSLQQCCLLSHALPCCSAWALVVALLPASLAAPCCAAWATTSGPQRLHRQLLLLLLSLLLPLLCRPPASSVAVAAVAAAALLLVAHPHLLPP
jgi:hypothetical protein